MREENTLINRVDESGIITLDLADLYPEAEIVEFDLKKFLVKEMVLMEKHFREELKKMDWEPYRGKTVAVYCSNDAIIPMWAYMLVTSSLEPFAEDIFFGTKNAIEDHLLKQRINSLNADEYRDARVVIKGCGDKPLPAEVYMLVTRKLQPVVKSLMYGEPCSTVPVYKRPKSP